MIFQHTLKLAGVYYYYSDCEDITGTQVVKLHHEPTNEYDINAIAVINNSNELYGYVEKVRTDYVRMWTRGKNDIEVKSRVSIDDYYTDNVRIMEQSIILTPSLHRNNSLKGKRFFVSGAFTDSTFYTEDMLKEMIRFNGGSITSKINNAHYVVYDMKNDVMSRTVEDALKEPHKFEMLSLNELVMLCSIDKKHKFFNKRIMVVTNNSELSQYINEYVTECGGTIVTSEKYIDSFDYIISHDELKTLDLSVGKKKITHTKETLGDKFISLSTLRKMYDNGKRNVVKTKKQIVNNVETPTIIVTTKAQTPLQNADKDNKLTVNTVTNADKVNNNQETKTTTTVTVKKSYYNSHKVGIWSAVIASCCGLLIPAIIGYAIYHIIKK